MNNSLMDLPFPWDRVALILLSGYVGYILFKGFREKKVSIFFYLGSVWGEEKEYSVAISPKIYFLHQTVLIGTISIFIALALLRSLGSAYVFSAATLFFILGLFGLNRWKRLNSKI